GASSSAISQAVCDALPEQALHANNTRLMGGIWGNGNDATINMFFDLEVKGTSIQLNGLTVILFDQPFNGPGGLVPSQNGNFALVNIYTIPTTRTSNEGSMAGWTQVGVGQVTVDSFISGSLVTNIVDPVSGAPVIIPNGTHGVALELVPTNATGTPTQTGLNAANVGSLHTLAPNTNLGVVWEDRLVKIDNDALQPAGWRRTGSGPGPFPLIPNPSMSPLVSTLNLVMDYEADPSDGVSLAYGQGCYERPKTAYESFPASTTGPDLIDPSTAIGGAGGMTWVFLGSSYYVAPGAPTYVTPISTNIVNGPFGNSNTGTWSEALSQPYSFPSTWNNGGFEHPGGVATQFTITSMGVLYLDDVAFGLPATSGPPSLGLGGATDFAASIRPYHCELDVTQGGGIYVDFGPAGTWVRVSWDQIQEPGIPTSVCTYSVTMYNGGLVEIAYDSLSNQAPGNNALTGYFEGNSAPIGNPIDWSVFVASPSAVTGNGEVPPSLSLDARPRIGTTLNMVTDNIKAGTQVGLLFLTADGLAPYNLALVGAPDCFAHVNFFTGLIASLSMSLNLNNQFSVPLVIPNNTVFLATNFHAQTMTLLPGVNALGVQTSNGLCVNVGN
ncbi:MAG: hypothetical protein ACI89X_005143, partial [Planctomycetota bacterium]